jgi:hypothetical protein
MIVAPADRTCETLDDSLEQDGGALAGSAPIRIEVRQPSPEWTCRGGNRGGHLTNP